ncbi:SDR family NAD(P)-dependent oxidoreductase [Amaricoccus sp. W119]|uniref:SDR family NAD(P)-dependent oxidoreductase n=1 Tax=Amaricoccus sp. W119 TaxID=3391833 RepID=UPI0039A6366D
MLLDGKVVIVTGGSRGIGRAIALGCAREGADVVVNYRSGPGEEVVEEIRSLGRRSVAAKGDVADPDTSRVMVEAAVETFGKVDVLVSNAGICPFHAFLDMPADVMRHTTEVNYFGAFYATQAAAAQMVKQGTGGAIVAMSSISALVGGEFQTHYTPTKAAVHSLMQSCAISLGPHGIRCNSVFIGTIKTDINKEDLTEEKIARMNKRIPLGRLGEPEDIVGPAIFLASDMARYVTGAGFLADGGAFVNLQ